MRLLSQVGRLGLEQLSETPEKPGVAQAGGAESGALGGDSASFRQAVERVLSLPLSDSEKAELVRRLLAGNGEAK